MREGDINLAEAAAAALAAGARRKALAKSIASASTSASGASSSGSGGKRNHHDLKKTPSTKVTPDAKLPCGCGDSVGPCQLTFEDTPEGDTDSVTLMTLPTLTLDDCTFNPEEWPDAQPRDEPPLVEGGKDNTVPRPLEPPAPPVADATPAEPTHTEPTHIEPARVEPAPIEPMPEAVLPSPPVGAKAMPPLPKAPQEGEIKFQPVTAKGMEAFFAVLRRPSTGQLTPGASAESLEPPHASVPKASSPPVPTPPMPDNTPMPDSTHAPVPDATPLATPVPDTAQAVSKSPATPAATPAAPTATAAAPATANLAHALCGGDGVMKPGDIISDELMQRMTDQCNNMDPADVEKEFELARKHAEFQAYVEGTRAEIGETGEEKDAWKFGEDILDLVVFKGFVEAREKLRNALCLVPARPPAAHPAPAKTTAAPAETTATPAEPTAPSVNTSNPPQAPATAEPNAPATLASTPAAMPAPTADQEDEASMAAAAEAEKKAARARYMQFYRNVRGPNCPDEVKEEFHKAMAEPNKGKSEAMVAALYKKFSQCSGDWLQSDIMLEHSRTHSTRSTGLWKWMSRDDLLVKYGNRATLVDGLIQEKEAAGLGKDNPEFPGNKEMRIYHCWFEDAEASEDLNSHGVRHIHTAGVGADEPTETNNGNNTGKGKGGPKGKGRGKGKNTTSSPNQPVPKAPKTKTPQQLARAAMSSANSNLLEIAALNMKLTKGGVSDLIRTALVQQMQIEETAIKTAKTELEQALASDSDMGNLITNLELANKKFKDQMKHVSMHLPKAKAKARSG